MTIPRLFGIGFIFLCACVAWSTLGASVVSRTGESDERLAKEVARLWGGRHEQAAPAAAVERPRMVTEQVQELLRHFAGFLGWVDSHIVSPSLLEFQFYGLAAGITLQFYE